MATTEYITLQTSGSEIDKKFYALLNGYTETHQKAQTIEDNIEGDPLITNGGIRIIFSYVIKTQETPDEAGFGSKDNLKALYDLNDPNGTPSDVITLIDHYGIIHTVKFVDRLDMTPLTVELVGSEAYFYIPIRFVEVIDE